MKTTLAGLMAVSVVMAPTMTTANAYRRHGSHFPHYHISPHEGIPRYGRTGSTMPPAGVPTGHENAAPIGETQTR